MIFGGAPSCQSVRCLQNKKKERPAILAGRFFSLDIGVYFICNIII